MKRSLYLCALLTLCASPFSLADDAPTAVAGSVNDDMSEFLAVATAALDEAEESDTGDNTTDATPPAANSALMDQRLRKHLGLGFADGLVDDASGEQSNLCAPNGHTGSYIDSSGIRECGDPSPSD
ncbi:MAG: hypothetical protein AB8G17_10700 [Gammaproteobacteria bacterium]